MGVTVPVYVVEDSGATLSNVYVSLLNEAFPVNGPPINRTFTTYHPPSSNPGPPLWQQQQMTSHAGLTISRDSADSSYTVSSTLGVFASQDARNQRRSPVDSLYISTTFDIATSVSTALYDAVKAKYPGSTDA